MGTTFWPVSSLSARDPHRARGLVKRVERPQEKANLLPRYDGCSTAAKRSEMLGASRARRKARLLSFESVCDLSRQGTDRAQDRSTAILGASEVRAIEVASSP